MEVLFYPEEKKISHFIKCITLHCIALLSEGGKNHLLYYLSDHQRNLFCKLLKRNKKSNLNCVPKYAKLKPEKH